MRASAILKSFAGAPPREVPLTEARLAAMLWTNRRVFADEAALAAASSPRPVRVDGAGRVSPAAGTNAATHAGQR